MVFCSIIIICTCFTFLKIRIYTKSQVTYIYEYIMRDLIKRILKEEVGVPRGIADSAKRLYLDLITRLKRKTVTGNSNFNLLFKRASLV
mgnify:CR=1 FL=1